jgi:hypothetical protein
MREKDYASDYKESVINSPSQETLYKVLLDCPVDYSEIVARFSPNNKDDSELLPGLEFNWGKYQIWFSIEQLVEKTLRGINIDIEDNDDILIDIKEEDVPRLLKEFRLEFVNIDTYRNLDQDPEPVPVPLITELQKNAYTITDLCCVFNGNDLGQGTAIRWHIREDDNDHLIFSTSSIGKICEKDLEEIGVWFAKLEEETVVDRAS